MKYFALLVTCLGFVTALSSQSIQTGFFLGSSVYQGDLAPSQVFRYASTFRPAGGFFVRAKSDRAFSFRFGVNAGTVTAADSLREIALQRALSFRSRIYELDAILEWNILKWRPGRGFFTWTLYGFGGVAGFYFNPQTKVEGQWVNLRDYHTEGQGLSGYQDEYLRTQIALPFGGGFKIRVTERFSFELEAGARKIFTDYLDDVSGTEVVYNDILTAFGPQAAHLSRPGIGPDPSIAQTLRPYKRGTANVDWYYMMGINLVYQLVGRDIYDGKYPLGCPLFNK